MKRVLSYLDQRVSEANKMRLLSAIIMVMFFYGRCGVYPYDVQLFAEDNGVPISGQRSVQMKLHLESGTVIWEETKDDDFLSGWQGLRWGKMVVDTSWHLKMLAPLLAGIRV